MTVNMLILLLTRMPFFLEHILSSYCYMTPTHLYVLNGQVKKLLQSNNLKTIIIVSVLTCTPTNPGKYLNLT